MRIWLTGTRSPTIAALVDAELTARRQRVEVLDSTTRTHLFGGERLVEVFLDEPTGRPDLVIDTDKESPAEAAEMVLAFIDGHTLD